MCLTKKLLFLLFSGLSVLSLALFLKLISFFLCEFSGAAIYIQPRCRCTDTQKTQIKTEKIQNFVSIAPGPHCNATVKHRHMEVEVCVNPSHKWVKEAML
uniref:Chemokine interleukin-8-like domain-containing protein n=1 Tax=Astyanax mexicanus TaxID=7994 RepID=A0A3B1IUA0_ASTMX